MNKLFYLKNGRGYFYRASTQRFDTGSKAYASKLTQEQINALRLDGVCGEAIAATVSFAVNYVRPQDLNGNSVNPNGNNPSKRRFATFDEAFQHGTKLRTRDESKGHVGFYVTETSDPVNATINWKTGLTNSL